MTDHHAIPLTPSKMGTPVTNDLLANARDHLPPSKVGPNDLLANARDHLPPSKVGPNDLLDIPFPTYDLLVAKIGNTPYDEASLDLKKVSSAINHLDETGEELGVIYALMIRYYLLEQQGKMRIGPTHQLFGGQTKPMILYGGKTFDIGTGLLYTFVQLPPLLQQIIVQYMREIARI